MATARGAVGARSARSDGARGSAPRDRVRRRRARAEHRRARRGLTRGIDAWRFGIIERKRARLALEAFANACARAVRRRDARAKARVWHLLRLLALTRRAARAAHDETLAASRVQAAVVEAVRPDTRRSPPARSSSRSSSPEGVVTDDAEPSADDASLLRYRAREMALAQQRVREALAHLSRGGLIDAAMRRRLEHEAERYEEQVVRYAQVRAVGDSETVEAISFDIASKLDQQFQRLASMGGPVHHVSPSDIAAYDSPLVVDRERRSWMSSRSIIQKPWTMPRKAR